MLSSGYVNTDEEKMEKIKDRIIHYQLDERTLNLLSTTNIKNLQDDEGNTVLHIAAKYGKSDNLKLLLPIAKENLEVKNHLGRTPLFEAVANSSDANDVRYLAEAGGNINTQDTTDLDTPLHVALRRGYTTLVKVLVEKKANPNIQNAEKNTCLHEAISSGKLDYVELICDAGGRLDIKNSEGKTPRGMDKINQITVYLREANKDRKRKSQEEKQASSKRRKCNIDSTTPSPCSSTASINDSGILDVISESTGNITEHIIPTAANQTLISAEENLQNINILPQAQSAQNFLSDSNILSTNTITELLDTGNITAADQNGSLPTSLASTEGLTRSTIPPSTEGLQRLISPLISLAYQGMIQQSPILNATQPLSEIELLILLSVLKLLRGNVQ